MCCARVKFYLFVIRGMIEVAFSQSLKKPGGKIKESKPDLTKRVKIHFVVAMFYTLSLLRFFRFIPLFFHCSFFVIGVHLPFLGVAFVKWPRPNRPKGSFSPKELPYFT